ncbi:unnamed protein product, partial [Didymodactylos carnosus]
MNQPNLTELSEHDLRKPTSSTQSDQQQEPRTQTISSSSTASSSSKSSTCSIDEQLSSSGMASLSANSQSRKFLFSNEPSSIFHFPVQKMNNPTENKIPHHGIEEEESDAIYTNLLRLSATMTQQQPTPVNNAFSCAQTYQFWPGNDTETNVNNVQTHQQWNELQQLHMTNHLAKSSIPSSNIALQRKMRSIILQQQQQQQMSSTTTSLNVTQPSIPLQSVTTNTNELLMNLNELCYRGFDELNALIQEQRWVQNYVNLNVSTLPNTVVQRSCSAQVLIVPEYFIFKCKKLHVSANHVYEVMATGRPELRLRDLLFVFKSWREAIVASELVHQEEEAKLRITDNYYINDTMIQA